MNPTSSQAPRKKRGKVKLEKIQDEQVLQVTFTKRRGGLFKKASEICIMTGVDLTLIAFSPRDKPFSFGSPEIQTNIDRLLGNEQHAVLTSDCVQQMIRAHHERENRRQNQELIELQAILTKEKEHANELQLQKVQGQMLKWYPRSTEDSSLDELVDLLKFMENFKEKVEEEEKKTMMNREGSKSLINNQALAWNHRDVPGSSSNPPHVGFNEFREGYMQDPRLVRVNVNHNSGFQAQSVDLLMNHINNDSMTLGSHDMNFGNPASGDLIGQQVVQDPLMVQRDITAPNSDFTMTQDDLDMVFNFLYSDHIPNDNMNFDTIGLQATHDPSIENFNLVDPIQHEPSSAPYGKGTVGPNKSVEYFGESSSSYDFDFPPSDFSTTGGPGLYPGGFNGGSGFGQQ